MRWGKRLGDDRELDLLELLGGEKVGSYTESYVEKKTYIPPPWTGVLETK
jgi:hypothetical protein